MIIAHFEIRDSEKKSLQEKLPDHLQHFFEHEISPEVIDQIRDVEIITSHTGSQISRQVIEQLPNLRLIATRTTGFDHIDLQAAKERNITVCNVPSYGENTVAEYALALLLTLARKIDTAIERVRVSGSFETEGLQGIDMMGKTIGVIGTGHIGQRAISIANGFGMNVLAFDAFPRNELQDSLHFRYVSLEELLQQSDIITLHVPYIPETHHLIGNHNIQHIKHGALLINTARGAVVETAAVVEALKNKHLAGAALDVLEEEGHLKDSSTYCLEDRCDINTLKTVLQNHVLMDMPNVLITPHNAFNTIEAEQRIIQTTVDNLYRFMENNPQNLVKLPD